MCAHHLKPLPGSAAAGSPSLAANRRSDDLVPERFYRDLISGMRNGVIVIRRDGTLVAINDAAYASLDMLPGSADVGRPIATVLADVPEMVRVLDGAFGSDPLPNRAEVKLAHTGRSIGFTLSLVRDPLGLITGAALFFRDLTRVEQLEERERLRDRLAALGEMAAAIAHEVKNPLAGIEVMAGLLKRRLSDNPEAQTMLADIIGEAKMANAIVMEVLDFVRPVRLQVEDVEVAELVQDSLHMADSLVPRGNVAVSVDVPEDLPPVQGDGHQLRQVFTNLLTNALEALGGEGRLIVQATALDRLPFPATPDHPQGPGVEVTVLDDGPGIPEAMRERIFNPFFTTKPRGSGLGLAIVRKVVDAHEGRIEVQPGLDGSGTCFRLLLPLAPSLEQVPVRLPDDGAPGGPRPR
ncbi:Sporulation kinase E [Luteitalea pratensis]|uniref:histidine kinase n=1 Tax=Luteitalea pratensis TaxID=1855912 RepID=A0A143PVZ0_LUTPR|nr:Sporulation kinase E [Luteitalea pratensis]